VSFSSTIVMLGLAVAASSLTVQSATAADKTVRFVSNYVELARQGNDVSELVSEHVSVSVIGVGSPYVHAEFIDYFRQCATQSIYRAKTIIDDRQLRYVVGEFICRDGETVEPLAKIGFGVRNSRITRIDLKPDLYLSRGQEGNR
jgi:hypothetical protein